MTRSLRIAVATGLVACAWTMARGATPEKPAEALYLQLGQVGLDPSRVYLVRGASLDRSDVHITLEDGKIAFTRDVMGQITGAFFEGDGEVLITPPNDVERKSMSLFTGMAILEEHFATGYFRFNDDAFSEMRPDLRATDGQKEFAERWDTTAQNLANADATRMLMTFSAMLPVKGASAGTDPAKIRNAGDRYLHARLQGTKLGIFDVLFDSEAAEQVQVGQATTGADGETYYNVWTSFSDTRNQPGKVKGLPQQTAAKPREDWVAVRRYAITTEVQPPKEIHSRARVELEVKESGSRVLLFELSRFLRVESVMLGGEVVEFIHNPAVEGTQLSRRGNDVVAVILPEPARAEQKIDLEFVYGGEVLAEAGSGLLYVGARGTWYPNRGLVMADFDLQFNYPQSWTLVATGKPEPTSATAPPKNGELTSHWVSERPIPLAGFNLGRYKVAKTRAGNVTVETYATQSVERNFPTASTPTIDPKPFDPMGHGPQTIPSLRRPSPAHNQGTVGEEAAQAIQYFGDRFGPYPYSQLELTQMPGSESQGWPGLVFLSSYAFLDQQDREQLHYAPEEILVQQLIPAHETAHQWWGDLVTWEGYRDQWFSEGLANYTSLMMLQEKNPAGFRAVMEKYRRALVEENKDGMAPKDAGPVTLGVRLLSSRFPEGYEAITYGRSTWLFHMLRMMLKDAEAQEGAHKDQGVAGSGSADEPFVRALRKVRQRYAGRSITTRELIDVFAEDLPPALHYEGKSSLDWFLEGWINGTALPKLELKSVKFTPKGNGAVVSGTILQHDAPEDLVTSVPVYAVIAGRQPLLLGRVFADGQESTFHVTAPAGVRKIVLDPNGTILTNPR